MRLLWERKRIIERRKTNCTTTTTKQQLSDAITPDTFTKSFTIKEL